MADKINWKPNTSAELDAKIVINIEGEKDIANLNSALENITRNSVKFTSYWKNQAGLIDGARAAADRYAKSLNAADGKQLINTMNALKATGANLKEAFGKDFNSIQQIFTSASNELGSFDGKISVDRFRELFKSFSELESSGLQVGKVFEAFENTGNVERYVQQINVLTEQLGEAKRYVTELEEAIANSGDYDFVSNLKDQLFSLEDELNVLKSKLETEFRTFLEANGVDIGSLGFSDFNEVNEYFEGIRNGVLTAQEAISRFKSSGLGQNLIQDSSADAVTIQNIINKLDELFFKIEEISTARHEINLSEMISDGDLSGAIIEDLVKRLQTIPGISNQAGDSFLKISQGEKEIAQEGASVLPIFASIISQLNNADTESGEAVSGLTKLVTELKALSSVDLSNLQVITTMFSNLGTIKELQIDTGQFDNLANGLEKLKGLQGIEGLSIISGTNLKGLSDLKISKAGLNNLAEYLPRIASINVGSLLELSKVDLSGFNNLKVSKASVKNLADLANVYVDLKKLETEIKSTQKAIESAGVKIPKSSGKGAKSQTDEEIRAIAEVEVAYKRLSTLKTSLSNNLKSLSGENLSSGNEAKLKTLIKIYDELEIKLKELELLKNKSKSSGDFTAYKQEYQSVESEANGLKVAIDQLVETNQKEITSAKEVANAEREAAAAEKEAANEREKAVRDEIKASQLEEKEIARIEKARASLLKKTQTLQADIERAKNFTSAKGSKDAGADYKNIQDQYDSVKSLANSLKSGEGLNAATLKNYEDTFNKINETVKQSKANIKSFGKDSKSLFSSISGLAEKFTKWFGVSQVIMRLVQYAKDAVSAVIEIDTAMTELKKVTDETSASYDKFLSNAGNRAKDLGTTVSDVVNATADFARLGYGIGEASKLADAALVYKNVGDGIEDISQASESVISTMQAFGIQANDSMQIVDKFNEIGNNFAISSEGVGEAMMRSSAALASANNTIDESIALAAAMNTQLQAPDIVGTTLKTLSMYLRAAKTEAEDAGESTEGMASSVSELREDILALTGNKVDIQIDEDTFKSTYQIIKELSQVWDELTDISQANIFKMIGGKIYHDVQKCA